MINKVAKLTLVATSLAPICLTLWFVEFSKALDWTAGWQYLLIAGFLTLLCDGLVWLAGKNLEKLPVKIKAVKPVDKKIVGFMLIYLLPLTNLTSNTISLPVLLFTIVIFFIVVQNSHAYHFNPLLSAIGYHFYEATIEGNITHVLITKQYIADCERITHVVQLTEYMILEPEA